MNRTKTAIRGVLRITVSLRPYTTILTSRPGTTISFLGAFPSRCLSAVSLDSAAASIIDFVRGSRHAQAAAQLAIDLQHQLDFILDQRRRIDVRERVAPRPSAPV